MDERTRVESETSDTGWRNVVPLLQRRCVPPAVSDHRARIDGQAILSGDADAVKEILEGFVRAQNVSKVAEDHGFSRVRVYQALEKTGNPTLDTICKIASAFVKAS
jgi:probable addiction module antidote protein